jgi:hypothetical protein
MKTTLDLPGDLVREIKDTVAELLRKELRHRTGKSSTKPSLVSIPLVKCRHRAELTPDQAAAALLKQETEWHHDPA